MALDAKHKDDPFIGAVVLFLIVVLIGSTLYVMLDLFRRCC